MKEKTSEFDQCPDSTTYRQPTKLQNCYFKMHQQSQLLNAMINYLRRHMAGSQFLHPGNLSEEEE